MLTFTIQNTAARSADAANRTRRAKRSADELIGIIRGVLADGHINVDELRFVVDWIERNRDVQQDPIAMALYDRLADAIADGVLDADEDASLLDALHAHVGGEARTAGIISQSTRSPFDDPLPAIVYPATFVLSGTFGFGARSAVVAAIEERGGYVIDSVTATRCLLVVGELASKDWLHSSYGNKIIKAMDYRSKGHPVRIVPEAHWMQHL